MENIALAGTAAYAGVALLFAVATYVEGWGRRDGWDRQRIAGLVSCIFWPLLIVIALAYARAFAWRDAAP
jgi:K+ transporter